MLDNHSDNKNLMSDLLMHKSLTSGETKIENYYNPGYF